MRCLVPLLVALCACGPGTGKLYASISADPALAMPMSTTDGWTVQFSHVVVAVAGYSVGGNGVTFPELPEAKFVDFSQATKTDLFSNPRAPAQAYDQIGLVLGRRPSASFENVNVSADVLSRMGPAAVWVEGTATKQSTTRTFQLGVTATLTYDGCMPKVNLEPNAEVTVAYRVHAQRLFFDDSGQLRFDAFGLSDAAPADGQVSGPEVAAVMTSSLPTAHYGATAGTLADVLSKRSLDLIGLGDSGTCSGR